MTGVKVLIFLEKGENIDNLRLYWVSMNIKISRANTHKINGVYTLGKLLIWTVASNDLKWGNEEKKKRYIEKVRTRKHTIILTKLIQIYH